MPVGLPGHHVRSRVRLLFVSGQRRARHDDHGDTLCLVAVYRYSRYAQLQPLFGRHVSDEPRMQGPANVFVGRLLVKAGRGGPLGLGPGPTWGWLFIVLSLGFGCQRSRTTKTEGNSRGSASRTEIQVAAPSPPGTLPPGCAIAVTLDPVALGPAIDLLGGILKTGSAQGGRIFGIDPKTDLRRITGCKVAGSTRASYVVLMSGRISPDLVRSAVSDTRAGLRAETLAGVPVAGGATSWIARRGGPDARDGELVLASDRNLLGASLMGPLATYRLDLGAPFSAVVAGEELLRILAGKTGAGETGLDRIREVNVTLLPGASALSIRALVGDASSAEKLAQSLRPLLSKVIAGLVGPGQDQPEVTATIDGGDLVLQAALPSGTWTTLATRMAERPARAHRRREGTRSMRNVFSLDHDLGTGRLGSAESPGDADMARRPAAVDTGPRLGN